MTIQEFYKEINGDYNDILGRLATEDRIKRFLLKFLETDDMSKLKDAWDKKDSEQIFAYSHRLKGIALNLSLSVFADLTSELTEEYRSGASENLQKATELFGKCCEEYNKLEMNIRKIS